MNYTTERLYPTPAQIISFLRYSNEAGERASAMGKHPFGAVLVAPDQQTVLLTQCNIDTVNHAESTLARIAATNYSQDYLWRCTLYTAVEPCCMCSGTIYWANIGCVVFGITERRLLEITRDHHENPTMSVSSQYVFQNSQKPVRLIGPVPEVEEEISALQRRFWQSR